MNITEINGVYKYFDMNGKEIHEGDIVKMDSGLKKVYRTENDELGTDATNPLWIESGRAVPTEFGIYPFDTGDEPIIVENKV